MAAASDRVTRIISMRASFKLAVVLVALMSYAPGVRAKDISYRKSWNLKQRAQEIVQVLVDYTRYCDSGCKYRYPGVEETLIVPYQRTKNSFYVWTFVKDIKNSEWFAHVTVRTKGNRTVVQFKMIKDKRIKTLEEISGKPHDTIFDTCITRYEVEEIFRDGQFVGSKLTFKAWVSVSGLIAIFSGAIRSGLEDTGKAIVENINKSGSKKSGKKTER
jgi:hypothetical protein